MKKTIDWLIVVICNKQRNTNISHLQIAHISVDSTLFVDTDGWPVPIRTITIQSLKDFFFEQIICNYRASCLRIFLDCWLLYL